ncbi:glycoside hydrolase family protein [Rhizobium sp. CFBP 8762]|uniref:glycoside hydrolase family protein n=1 Tax=Rhizobium sp. CFBP 8762 TaxID=2775279 RepID=UPI001FD29593|nr:glycoside hydrolase family protein [Rhizobium sp. CFBP 8762]
MNFNNWLQSRLTAHGYPVGAIDGIVGSKTIKALYSFLSATKLTDGDFIEIAAKLDAKPETAPTPVSGEMKTSANGRKLIAEHEGNMLTAYQDSVGVWTIGVGHTSAAGAPVVTKGMKITAAQSDEILSRDLANTEKEVRDLLKVSVTQNEFDALVSLGFNIGGTALGKSTLIRKLNAGDWAGAADQFLVWNKAKGRVLAGLTKRRKAERTLFLSK